jgi:hypothetical protein
VVGYSTEKRVVCPAHQRTIGPVHGNPVRAFHPEDFFLTAYNPSKPNNATTTATLAIPSRPPTFGPPPPTPPHAPLVRVGRSPPRAAAWGRGKRSSRRHWGRASSSRADHGCGAKLHHVAMVARIELRHDHLACPMCRPPSGRPARCTFFQKCSNIL